MFTCPMTTKVSSYSDACLVFLYSIKEYIAKERIVTCFVLFIRDPNYFTAFFSSSSLSLLNYAIYIFSPIFFFKKKNLKRKGTKLYLGKMRLLKKFYFS